ncbi:MAG: hypothetical protein M1814_004607 [Vezdaea aestivalis]|nr:MAG: hypothetical protein M1814_004607 [Vezdaea aestivalis]
MASRQEAMIKAIAGVEREHKAMADGDLLFAKLNRRNHVRFFELAEALLGRLLIKFVIKQTRYEFVGLKTYYGYEDPDNAKIWEYAEGQFVIFLQSYVDALDFAYMQEFGSAKEKWDALKTSYDKPKPSVTRSTPRRRIQCKA